MSGEEMEQVSTECPMCAPGMCPGGAHRNALAEDGIRTREQYAALGKKQVSEQLHHEFSIPDGELDEVFIENSFVHIERMSDTCFWIGIDPPETSGLPAIRIFTGIDRGIWFFNLEEDCELGEGGIFLSVQRRRNSKSIRIDKALVSSVQQSKAQLAAVTAERDMLRNALEFMRPMTASVVACAANGVLIKKVIEAALARAEEKP